MARRPIPEPEPPESDLELEETIAELIRQKYAAPEGSAEYLLAMRALAGLRYTRELAGPIMEARPSHLQSPYFAAYNNTSADWS
jgi:hypothetical protein